MGFSGGIVRACAFAGAVLVGLSLAACTKPMQPKEYGVGSLGAATPGSERDFAVNVGDVVHFQVDSSALTPRRKASSAGRPSGSINIRNTRSPSKATPMSAARANTTSRSALAAPWR